MLLTFDDLAPLDWPQLKCLLWEQAPAIDRRDPRWDEVAARVNRKCAVSEPQPGSAYADAFNAIASAMPDLFERDPAQGGGQRAWLELLYVRAQRLFGRPRFMNLGFAGLPEARLPIPLRDEDEPNRFAIQLYHQLLQHLDVAGGRILEVGCGGCGGLDYITGYLGPDLAVGLDLVAETLSHARRSGRPGAQRLCLGRAEQLPFRDRFFDAIVCVESSEHYHDIDGFLREARRILKSGGALLLADLRWNGGSDGDWGVSRSADAFPRQLLAAGFAIERYENITSNVLRSIELQDDAKREALGSCGLTAGDEKQFREVMLCHGSRNHDLMSRGDIVYLSAICRDVPA
jgi:SAM-dependent methyltransferase